MPKRAQSPSRALDKTDRRILAILQDEARIPNVKLARRVNLSPTPCLERVRRLEREGYIRGYRAILNPQYLDAALMVFVEIRLTHTSPDVFREFRRAVVELPEVLDCHLVSGDFDYLIKARVADMAAYRALLGDRLLQMPGVSGSRTYVVMEEVKETLSLAVGP